MILSSTRSKCFSVIAPHDQIIMVEYEAPDLQVPPETMEEATQNARATQGIEEPDGGLDSQWNKRMKERLERIKSKKLRDASITVTQKDGSFRTKESASKQSTSFDINGNMITSGQGRVREELVQQKGRIEFLTGKDGGTVEICVQSILASTQKPARFYLKVDMAADESHYYDDDQYDYGGKVPSQEKKKTKNPENLEHRELTTQMTRLERDLQTLQNRVKACLNNADHIKDQEYVFHEQSISMNRATRYWPIIQVAVLLVTGFTQANHIVRYMKTHHIGI